MQRLFAFCAAALVVTTAGCASDHTPVTPPQSQSPEVAAMLADGFATNAAAFGETNNSFVAGIDMFAPWMPMGFGMSRGLFHGSADLMGGGLGADFAGGGPMFQPGRGGMYGGGMFGGGMMGGMFGGGPFLPLVIDIGCSFSATTGRITCPPITLFGVTIDRSFAFTDAAGHAQSALDSTTASINTRVSVKGTIVSLRRTDTTTVAHASDQTVGGLTRSSTQRTVNGTSGGTESTTGLTAQGTKFTTARLIGDTTQGLVIPVQTTGPTYPTAGRVVRSMQVTVNIAGEPTATSTRREVITYDGTNVAKVVITFDGATKTCTLPLPRGPLACP